MSRWTKCRWWVNITPGLEKRIFGASNGMSTAYRVTHQVVVNLPLTTKQKFRFGLARPGQARPKRNLMCHPVHAMPTLADLHHPQMNLPDNRN